MDISTGWLKSDIHTWIYLWIYPWISISTASLDFFCICWRVFGNGPSNAAGWILPRPTRCHGNKI